MRQSALGLARFISVSKTRRFMTRKFVAPLLQRQAIGAYVRRHGVRKLQIGSGPNILEGWLNSDVRPCCSKVVFLDARKSFPFPDSTLDYVFSEHLIEHLSYGSGLRMLQECFRVLKPGGRVRIATPSLESLIGLYGESDVLQQRYVRWIAEQYLLDGEGPAPCFILNNAFYNWGHRFIYDARTLEAALEKAGFVDITCHLPGESGDGVLRGIESHGAIMGDEDLNRFETMVLEGRHPDATLNGMGLAAGDGRSQEEAESLSLPD